MDNYITLLGSIVIGGLMLINFMNYQSDLSDHTYVQNSELILQETAIEVIEMIEADLHKIGESMHNPAFAIYDSNAISFCGDVDNDGAVDTVRYYLSSTGDASSTPNPNDRVFYREVNGSNTFEWAVGITNMEFRFFDSSNDVTTNFYEVRAVEVSLNFESTIPYDGEYASYFWSERITPPNLLLL